MAVGTAAYTATSKVPLTPPAVAVIRAWPGATPVMVMERAGPALLMLATAALLVAQVGEMAVVGRPEKTCPVAASQGASVMLFRVIVSPTTMEIGAAITLSRHALN
jgi:hypothetical protein